MPPAYQDWLSSSLAGLDTIKSGTEKPLTKAFLGLCDTAGNTWCLRVVGLLEPHHHSHSHEAQLAQAFIINPKPYRLPLRQSSNDYSTQAL